MYSYRHRRFCTIVPLITHSISVGINKGSISILFHANESAGAQTGSGSSVRSVVWKCVVAECSGMIGEERIQMSVGETPQCANNSHAGLPTAWQTTSLTGPAACTGCHYRVQHKTNIYPGKWFHRDRLLIQTHGSTAVVGAGAAQNLIISVSWSHWFSVFWRAAADSTVRWQT